MRPFFSVIIPTYNRNDLLRKCLDRLDPKRQQLAPETYEVIVTDDGRDVSTRELIGDEYPWARWVAGPQAGPAANRNNGADAAGGDWLVFIDDDCLPHHGLLSGYRDAIRTNDAQVFEGKTSPDGLRSRVDMECPINESGGYLWSCNMAIRKDLFLKLGGFDVNFPAPAMEDVDLRTRLIKAGKGIVFVPEAVVKHPWRIKKGFNFWRQHSASRIYFVEKHPEMIHTVSLRSLGFELARKLLKELPQAVWDYNGRGVIRELALTFYTTYSVAFFPRHGR
jgi:GT2 family glycosyltransferase